jgi:OmpR family response regulator RpaB
LDNEAISVGRILVADDDIDIRRIGERILCKAGFEVVTASDGREAIEIFRQSPNDWALVITDLRMPRSDGLSLIRNLRKIRDDLPVLLMTGYADDSPRILIADDPRVSIIRKPFTSSVLIEQVSSILVHVLKDDSSVD